MSQYILHIESSAGICSVAVSKGAELSAEVTELFPNRAAERLHVMIDEVLSAAGIEYKDLSAVAISGGPGSYTGLRIGAAAAKGICYALGIPLLAVESLQALQSAVKQRLKVDAEYYIALLDARRMDVFAAVMDLQGNYLMPPVPMTLTSDAFESYIKRGSVVFFGSGAGKFADLASLSGDSVTGAMDLFASDMIAIAWSNFQENDFKDIATYEPSYYKEVYFAKK